MNERQKKNLEKLGGRVTTIEEFLGLTAEEAAMIEMLNDLSVEVRARLEKSGLTQRRFAALLGSSQSRVNLMLQGHSSVGLGLYVRSMLLLGATRAEIGRVLAGRPATATNSRKHPHVSTAQVKRKAKPVVAA